MRSINHGEVRVACSQLFRCCRKTLARETRVKIFSSGLQRLGSWRSALTFAGTRRAGPWLVS